MSAEKRGGDKRLEGPAVENVKGAGNQEERIAEITKHVTAERG